MQSSSIARRCRKAEATSRKNRVCLVSRSRYLKRYRISTRCNSAWRWNTCPRFRRARRYRYFSGKRCTLFSCVQLHKIIIHFCSFTATSLKYSQVEVYKYIHTYVQHVERDSHPRSPSESRDIESYAFSLKRSITRGRKINDGVRKGMPLRRQAAVIDFAIRPRRHCFSSR